MSKTESAPSPIAIEQTIDEVLEAYKDVAETSPRPWRVEWEMLGTAKSPVILGADNRVVATFPFADVGKAEADARLIVEMANAGI